MKSITKLLQQMNESDKFDSHNHHISVYGDGSGFIFARKSGDNFAEANFSNREEMCYRFDEIERRLNGEPTDWQL